MLRGKKNCIFWTYGSKVMDVWSFEEKYGQGGHVWSQSARVDYISPKRWAVGIRNLEKSPLKVSSPIFWTLSLHLGRWNLPSLMEYGNFKFSNCIFAKFRVHLDLHIHRWILVSWKNEITKNSTRIASVMEIFCTLLQCRVDLSMFHLSSTSKIWHTSI
jgi:hypothetical protein